MDIVKQQQIREWTLLGLVGLMALIANLPLHLLEGVGLDQRLLMAVLGLMVVFALFLYVRLFFFLLYALLAVGANLPAQWADSLGINQTPLLVALIAMVALSLLNYGARMLPTGLEAKKPRQNTEATKVLVEAIERRNLPYVKTLLTMDFDLDAPDEAGVTPLMCAARRGEFKIVQMLIKGGASALPGGPSGRASDLALQNNFPSVSEFLKRVEEVQTDQARQRAAAQPRADTAIAA